MDIDPPIMEGIGHIQLVVKLAAGHGARKALSKGRLVGVLEPRVWSEDQHDQFMILDFAQEIDIVPCACFRMSRDSFSPLSQADQHVDFPALRVSDSRLCVWGILSIDAVQDTFDFAIKPRKLEEMNGAGHISQWFVALSRFRMLRLELIIVDV